MHVVTLSEPEISDREARFSWTVEPETELYRQTHFHLRFDASVDLSRVPRALWWRIALICLHPQWLLLRPCRIVLPVRLWPGEREFWLRLLDAGVSSLEAYVGGSDTARTIELLDGGPVLEPWQLIGGTGGVVSCFSGGRDSLTQAALLQELGEQPLLVTTTSPREGSIEHETPRRQEVMEQIVHRRGVELIEVRSDLRGSWSNGFAASRYPVGVNEVSDTMLYAASALAVAAARGAHDVLLASEAEVQENSRWHGTVAQHKHFMYSAVTQRALSGLLAPVGLRYGSLTYPLHQFQVQRLLAIRYADLRDLQYSCWEMGPREHACSRCSECLTNAFNLVALDVAPQEAGIDLATLLRAQRDWRPRPAAADAARAAALPGERAGAHIDAQLQRCFATVEPDRIAALIARNGGPAGGRGADALGAYRELRERALEHPLDPEPGYRDGFLELIEPRWRERLRAILEEHFDPAPLADYAGVLRRSRLLSDWVAAPLSPTSEAHAPRRLGARPSREWVSPGGPHAPRARARAPEPVTLAERELDAIRRLIPDPEPVLGRRADGNGGSRPVLPVAETRLDGNELRYVTECVQTNWISSAGAFIPRFEQAFAEAAGCRHGVACSSGTAALHLALAAAGIGPGDEVLIPTFTMIATANAVRYLGATPVLLDTDPATWNLDLDRVTDAIGRRTRAIVVMHTYGSPVDVDALQPIADRNGLVVIEDAAEAHGAELRGRRVGGLATVAAFSFYGNKIVATGEGGMVTGDDERIMRAARRLRDHGFSAERHFWHRLSAFNYRMSNLQAAVGLAQTERLDELVDRRRETARRYRERLAGVTGIELPPEPPGCRSSYWMFGIVLGEDFGCSRDELRRRLAAAGIETRTFFVPIHLQPIYRRAYAGRRFPAAERLGRDGLYLPSGPNLADEEIAYVAEQVRGAAATAGAQPGGTPSSV